MLGAAGLVIMVLSAAGFLDEDDPEDDGGEQIKPRKRETDKLFLEGDFGKKKSGTAVPEMFDEEFCFCSRCNKPKK